ncbi:Wzz/FepE/Etk N-terminal domain-containing protein, partial [Salmonella enterica subsp. enterica serovar Anatum]|nr:Wzz/FepE/Etk N-terminal domain-containing protein [Salmonella enterica subsp. enterica serovar Anatum]
MEAGMKPLQAALQGTREVGFTVISIGLLFALIALAYTFFARQEWSATAITDRPTVNMLGGYYSQQQ